MLCFSCETAVQIYVTGLCQGCHEIARAVDDEIITTPVTPAGSDHGSSQAQETPQGRDQGLLLALLFEDD